MLVADAGKVQVGGEYLRIWPTGESASVQSIGDTLISSDAKRVIRLGDIDVPSRYSIFLVGMIVLFMRPLPKEPELRPEKLPPTTSVRGKWPPVLIRYW